MKIMKLYFIILLVIASTFSILFLIGCSRSINLYTKGFNTSQFIEGFNRISKGYKEINNVGKGIINDLEFSPDGKQLAIARSEGLWIFKPAGRTETTELIGHKGEVLALAWSDNNTIASGGEDKTIRLWKAKTGESLKILKGHKGKVTTLTFSPDGKTLASGSRDKKTLSNRFRETLSKIQQTDEIPRALISEDLDLLSNEHKQFDNTICLWNPHTGKLQQTIKGAGTAFTFSLDGKILAIAYSDLFNRTATLEFLNIDAGNRSERTIRIVEDNSIVYLGAGATYYDGQFYNYKSGAILYSYVSAFTFPPYSTRLAVSRARAIYRSDSETYQNPKIKVHNADYPLYINTEHLVTIMAYSPRADYLATGNTENTIQLWDVKTKRLRYALKGHTDKITALALSRDGILASGSQEGTLFLWGTK